MNSHISISEGKIEVRAPYKHLDTLRSIPGARWNQALRCWQYPVSQSTIRDLVNKLTDAVLDPDTRELYSEAETKTQGIKDAATLPEFRTKTRSWLHQQRAYWWAKNLPASYLALDMGTGKSKVVVDLVVNEGYKRVLVLAPLSVVPVWPKQFQIHGADQVQVLALGDGVGSVKKKCAKASAACTASGGRPVVVVVNYESAWREPFREWTLKQSWDLIVLDEAHRIKAPGGRASMYCKALRSRGKRRMALSGTPMPHSPVDVYAQFRFLDPGIYGDSFTRFKNRYARMGGFQNKQIVGFINEDELSQRFYSIAYRVMADDVLDLPEAVHTYRECLLSPREWALYLQLESVLVAEVAAGTVTAGNALVKLLRLQQLTSGFLTTDEGVKEVVGDSKRRLFADVIEDFAPAEPLIIFARFHSDLDQIKQVCEQQGRECGELSGRRNDLAEWQAGRFPCLAVQIQAGGVGVDLTRARYCLYFSVGFSLGDYQQSIKRVHRPGQHHNVTYIHLIAAKTVDEQVYKAIQDKTEVIDTVLGAWKGEGNGQQTPA